MLEDAASPCSSDMSASESLSPSELLPDDEDESLVEEELCFIFFVGIPGTVPGKAKGGTGDGVIGVGACTISEGMDSEAAGAEGTTATLVATEVDTVASAFLLFGAWWGDLVADFTFFGALGVFRRVGVCRSEGCGVDEDGAV